MPELTVSLASFSPTFIGALFLMTTRISSALIVAPVFGNRSVPMVVKIGLSAVLAFLVFPTQMDNLGMIPSDMFSFLGMLAKEVLLGTVIGFSYMLVVLTIQMGAHLMGLQIGLGMANIIDPVSSNQVSILDQFYTILALLVFLTLDGHHRLILTLQKTFELAPLGSFSVTEVFTERMISITGNVLVSSIRMALPVIVTLILADVVLGIIARMVPQLNILIVGLPLKIILGLFILVLTIPASVVFINSLFNGVSPDIYSLLRAFR